MANLKQGRLQLRAIQGNRRVIQPNSPLIRVLSRGTQDNKDSNEAILDNSSHILANKHNQEVVNLPLLTRDQQGHRTRCQMVGSLCRTFSCGATVWQENALDVAE